MALTHQNDSRTIIQHPGGIKSNKGLAKIDHHHITGVSDPGSQYSDCSMKTSKPHKLYFNLSCTPAHRLRHPEDMVCLQCIIVHRWLTSSRWILQQRKRYQVCPSHVVWTRNHLHFADWQDPFCPQGCCYSGVHDPPSQTRTWTLFQKTSSLGYQIRCRVCTQSNGHVRRETWSQAQPGCLGPGYQNCSSQTKGEARECVLFILFFVD